VTFSYSSASVFRRRFIDVIDDQDGHGASAFFELQAELFAAGVPECCGARQVCDSYEVGLGKLSKN
jgi:hypothetical protein